MRKDKGANLCELSRRRTELVRASTLPCFTTDYGQLRGGYAERVNIPLTDAEAHVTFYLAEKK